MKFPDRMLAAMLPLLVGSALAGSALADDDPVYDRFFLMPNMSTLGAGIEGGYRMNEYWQVRVGVNGYSDAFVYKRGNYDLHSRLSLLNAGVTVDYFPFAGDVYLSGGARLSANSVGGKVKNLHGKLKGGGDIFVPDPLTDFTVRQNVIQPYLGAGYSLKVRDGVSLNFNLGALYAGKPDLDVDSRAHRLGFSKKDIRAEVERAQSRLSPFKVYPVVQVGLKFEF